MEKTYNNNLTLVVMAAGMGSRFGGLKQLQLVGPNGELILDYSLMDAMAQGFNQVIFIIKEENQELFHEAIGEKVQAGVKVSYAYQKVDDVPPGFDDLAKRRVKPWGTAHAVYAARNLINSPFMVINADDFYGTETFKKMASLLRRLEKNQAAMVAFPINKTLSENGSVSRGVCRVNEDSELVSLKEHTKIFSRDTGIISEQEGGNQRLHEDTLVSMNVWGFLPEILPRIEEEFVSFLEHITNVEKEECYLPEVVSSMIEKDQLKVFVEKTQESWYGVTYKEDQKIIEKGILKLHEQGRYKSPKGEGSNE